MTLHYLCVQKLIAIEQQLCEGQWIAIVRISECTTLPLVLAIRYKQGVTGIEWRLSACELTANLQSAADCSSLSAFADIICHDDKQAKCILKAHW